MTVNRDTTASRNILQLFHHQIHGTLRSQVLCRGGRIKSASVHECPV
jgi:hypothetical protein